jgi:N-acetylmuramic acid 6-phosphate etherase
LRYFGIDIGSNLWHIAGNGRFGGVMGTEDVSIRYRGLDTWPADEVVAALVEGQLAAVAAVSAARPAITAAAQAAAERLAGGTGRIVYVGAGASGRLGVQDGVELFPTYGWPHDRLVYLMAGGETALVHSVEGAEDDADDARARIAALDLGSADVVISVAASGRTPFAVAAASAAREAGAVVVGITNNAGTPLARESTHPIELLTGAEVVAGSTRMAAGTAQKAALNVLSTTIMVALHRVYDNVMVDLSSVNAKLDKRRLGILRHIVPSDEVEAREALARADGRIKVAALALNGLGEDEANAMLDSTGGDLRAAIRQSQRQQQQTGE